MSITVNELQNFLSNFDGEARVELHGARNGRKYHFHEWYGAGFDNPTMTVAIEGTRDFDVVQDIIDQEDFKKMFEQYRSAYLFHFGYEEEIDIYDDLEKCKHDPIGAFIKGVFNANE